MHIALKTLPESKKRLLKDLGVPPALFQPFSFDTNDYLTNFDITGMDGKANSYRTSRQEKVVEHLMTSNWKTPNTFFFESSEHYIESRRLALRIFGRAIEAAMELGPWFGNQPRWLYLTSNINHSFKEIGNSPLIVIDNITTGDQSVVKKDKLRDIVNEHSDKTLLLLFQGTKSVEWSRDILGLRPFGVCHFNGYKRFDSAASVIRI